MIKIKLLLYYKYLIEMEMIKDYIIKERLGTGAFGIAYKVLQKSNNNIYVIKQIPLLGLTYQQKKEAKLEANILSSVKSDYIVRYYESFEEKNYLNIVMEYCNGGDLSQYINKNKQTKYLLEEDLIWNIFLKITIGLATLHKSNILHRDLKTQNIFMTKNLDIKIGDFGVAKILTNSGFAKTIIGTPYYLSPELCEEQPYNNKSDVWALGCILYELSSYKHPFNAKSQASLILKILQDKPAPIHNYYSENLQKLIYLILDKNHLTRPSCYDILNLPFVVEKSKNLKLYNKIKSLYTSKISKKKLINNYSNKTYINQREKKNNIYEQITVPTKERSKNYNIIKSNRHLKSEQNHKTNNHLNNQNKKGKQTKNYNNHILFISKSNDNFKKINYFKEKRSKSCERNQELNKGVIKNKKIINNDFDIRSNNEKKNKIKNISYINNQNGINKSINKDNNGYKNQTKEINISRKNDVINSINEFEKKMKNKNNIKKILIINNQKNSKNHDSSYLNIEYDLLKNIKINDIIDNKYIDSMIQNNLSQRKKEQKIINMKEFANYLNSYVSKINNTDFNENKRKENLSKKNCIYTKENLRINNKIIKKNKDINNIIKKNKPNEKIEIFPISYSFDNKQNQNLTEQKVVNNIYENRNKSNISNYKVKKFNVDKANNNKNILSIIQNEKLINRINSEKYSRNTEKIRKSNLNSFKKEIFNNDNNQQNLNKKEKNNFKKCKTKSGIYN